VNVTIAERLESIDRVPSPPLDRANVLADRVKTSAYIQSYFEQIHPVYNFLDRRKFEAMAFGPQNKELLEKNKAWTALYYAVLALGSQYHDQGSFLPGKNFAWKLFASSLALYPDLLIKKSSILTVQVSTR
jgi:hypothetical protein